MKFITTQNVRHKGKLYAPGTEIDLTEKEAARVAAAVVKPEPKTKAASKAADSDQGAE
jgi:hypothetical protein